MLSGMEPTPPEPNRPDSDRPETARLTGPDRRLALLRAALELFSTRGYDGTTTKAVAGRVGVTEALLFKHFRAKQELLRAVVEEFGPRRLFAPPPEESRALSAREAVEQFVSRYLDTFWDNRACLRMMLMATERDLAVFEEIRAQFGQQALYLYTLLLEREDRGELRPGSAAPATDVISSAAGGFLQRALGEEPPDWPAARSLFVSHLLRVVFGGVESGPAKKDS